MARTQTQAQTTAYGANIVLEDSTTQFEVGFLDSGALVAGTVKVTAQGSSAAVEWPVAAGGTYYSPLPRGVGSRVTLNLKAASGTPTGQVQEL